MIKHTNLDSGLSLVEILGAVAVIATVTAVSVISVKDTVQAGQKASAQREIQTLNSALQSFKSAGGVIPENATVDDALQAIKLGVDLAGSEYAPLLANEPQREVTIAGETFDLAYDPEDGFSYVSDDGSGVGFGGADLAATSSGGGGYTPGVTPVTAENVNEALAALSAATPGSPEYEVILADLAVSLASGDLTEEEQAAVLAAAQSEGFEYDGALGWNALLGYPDASHLPDSAPLLSAFNAFGFGPASIEAFLSQWLPQGFSSVEEWAADIPVTLENLATWYQWSDPAFDYFNDLNSLEQASLYRALVEEADPAAGSLLNLLKYLYSEAEVVSQILTNLPAGEAAAALDSLRGNLAYLDLSGLNLTGWNTIGVGYLEGVSFAGSNVTAEQLNGAIWIGYTDLSGTGITRADLEALGRDSAELDTITF